MPQLRAKTKTFLLISVMLLSAIVVLTFMLKVVPFVSIGILSITVMFLISVNSIWKPGFLSRKEMSDLELDWHLTRAMFDLLSFDSVRSIRSMRKQAGYSVIIEHQLRNARCAVFLAYLEYLRTVVNKHLYQSTSFQMRVRGGFTTLYLRQLNGRLCFEFWVSVTKARAKLFRVGIDLHVMDPMDKLQGISRIYNPPKLLRTRPDE